MKNINAIYFVFMCLLYTNLYAAYQYNYYTIFNVAIEHRKNTIQPVKLTCSFGMHNPLRNPLSVEVRHLISENHILNQQRPSWPHSQDIQLVSYGDPCSCGQGIWFLNSKGKKLQVKMGGTHTIISTL